MGKLADSRAKKFRDMLREGDAIAGGPQWQNDPSAPSAPGDDFIDPARHQDGNAVAPSAEPPRGLSIKKLCREGKGAIDDGEYEEARNAFDDIEHHNDTPTRKGD